MERRRGTLMKYLVISDIHGSRTGAEIFEEAYRIHQPDAVLCLGDVLYHGPRNPVPENHDPKEVARIMNQYAERIFAVRGNCEAEVDGLMLEFPYNAEYNSFLLGSRRVFMTHGHIFNPDHLPRLNAGDILLYGHTHIPDTACRDGIYTLNPGSITFPKENHPKSYAVLGETGFTVYNDQHRVYLNTAFDEV